MSTYFLRTRNSFPINIELLEYNHNPKDLQLRTEVWKKATPIEECDSNLYRYDVFGKIIGWNYFGENGKGSEYRWEIDHILPRCCKDDPNIPVRFRIPFGKFLNYFWNLQPLSYDKNHEFGGKKEGKYGFTIDGTRHSLNYFIDHEVSKRVKNDFPVPFSIYNL